MGCISEWGATVNGNVCVSDMHNYAFNRFHTYKHTYIKKILREFPFHWKMLKNLECFHLIFVFVKTKT